MSETDNRVDLTDLDVISRYSLAVRTATADRDELIAVLRADLDWLQAGRTRATSVVRRATAAKAAPKTPAKRVSSTAKPAAKRVPSAARAKKTAKGR